MPLQNRVTPTGEIISTPARGTFMGNRGILHDPHTKTLKVQRWRHKAWICCVLEYKDWQHPIMGAGAYTELFFLDEATALAAGHRPCALCRRTAFNQFKRQFAEIKELDIATLKAAEMDAVLHAERVTRKRDKIVWQSSLNALPDGVFVCIDDAELLVLGDSLLVWGASGYREIVKRPDNTNVNVLTPYTTVGILSAGYRPALHHSSSTLRRMALTLER